MPTSFLVDPQIVDAVKSGRLVIQDPDGQAILHKDGSRSRDAGLDAHGYILRARRICSWRNGRASNWFSLKDENSYTLRPREQVFVETYEHLHLGPSICGTIHALARLTLLGLSHISTTVHPGWGSVEKPQALRIAITNMGEVPWVIRDKEIIARILFHESAVEASIPAPSSEEVFQRAETAIKVHKKAARRNKRTIRMIRLLLLLILGTSAYSSFSGGFSLEAAVRPIVTLFAVVVGNFLINEYFI